MSDIAPFQAQASCILSLSNLTILLHPETSFKSVTMTAAGKRQKREDYRKTHKEEGNAELPKKKFYRQRAHANPFSDHQLT